MINSNLTAKILLLTSTLNSAEALKLSSRVFGVNQTCSYNDQRMHSSRVDADISKSWPKNGYKDKEFPADNSSLFWNGMIPDMSKEM